ncbi:DUF3667 domain-containing protein [Aestuariivivens sediminis]|uniref:DUF3667 domain-containing protein n=1 Tax=Aestuariivivens sediminis TaxID=2913557 RepID=UPI001F56B913|nr:DUF3667 domain-containing protein [Aestuariivivens sediminis]
MKSNQDSCKNCEQEFDATFNFCPYCGQQVKEDLTVSVLFYNTISNYFSFDARFFKSFLPLIFKPGLIPKRFVAGKRLKYLHPAQFYLFVSVVFFFIFSFKVREYNSNVDKALKTSFESVNTVDSVQIKRIDSTIAAKAEVPPILNNPNIKTGLSKDELKALDSTIKSNTSTSRKTIFNLTYDLKKLDSLNAAGASTEEQLKFIGMDENTGFIKRTFLKQLLKFHKQRGGGIVQAFFDSIPVALFFLLPLFAFILKLLYWRRGQFAHHLVFSFYYFSFLFIVLGVIITVNEWIIDIPDSIDWLIMLSTFVYLWLGLKRFYQQGYFISFFKAGMTTFLYMSLIVPTALIVILATAFLFY